MEISFAELAVPEQGALVVGALEGRQLLPMAAALDGDLGGLLAAAMARSRFTGKADQTLMVHGARGRVLIYGLGDGSGTGELWAENAGGRIHAAFARSGEEDVSILFEPHAEGADPGIAARGARLGYGALLRAYRFDKYKTTQKEEDIASLRKLTVLLGDPAAAEAQFEECRAVADGVFLTRDLVSEPPNVLHPESYAARIRELAEDGLEVEVLGEAEMAELGMGALLGVGQGSVRESQLAVIRWNGAPADADQTPIAFIGKGVCFDTGGISLKPASNMEDMKWDMAGSGVVVGLMRVLARRKAAVNAIGMVGLVENMPDGKAQRPGDIVTSMSGQTIEIINTDAEGRLVLADALWYCQERFKPRFMLDLATLTGAMLVALGKVNCGFYTNDDALAGQLDAAAASTGETVWRMPLGAEYNKLMDSSVADVKNAGGRWAGSGTAACFLERFVNKVPWVHMDIAGMAWSSEDKPTVPKGGTGWGVRLLNALVKENYEA